ncbi:Rpn family recombination-promoting nuclease/putative transposase [Candidatus Cardinium hertigii]|uniref:Rpn family recombination-promoting nuclease/putative transposase n=1 Tax=Candidatus Cardinium hertigii TaxID=247481 RepID=A0A3N2QDK7_9BACT|nr:Rpn family recombination-promoting nuclease/putative transposase [Candidatus Cardinium hertigii]ROT47861.1 Rpn family recombination-promoting nuclease/putative transposase [Candidatus Cardinium hertigii]
MQAITPRVDVAFKKLFGVEENKDLLISLINAIVSAEDQVADIILLNPYNPQNFRGDKASILDLKAKAVDGKLFNIEIQISDEADYDKRALFYWAKLYTEQLQAGQGYGNLSKAIGIHILNFISIVEEPKYHNVFRITEEESNALYFKDLELHTIELKKFTDNPNEALTDLIDKVKTALDRWVAFLTRHDLLNKDNLPPPLNDVHLKKALQVLNVMNFTPEERTLYEGHLKWLWVEENTVKKAKNEGKEEGIQIGKEEGIQIGKEEGIQMGKEEGIQIGETQKAMAIAQNLLQEKLPIAYIAKVTGLTISQVEQLYNVSSQ